MEQPFDKTFIIEGNNIHDIPSFYAEINRLFMSEEDWKLGNSLDALDDMLYGAYGALAGSKHAQIVWKNCGKNRNDLGMEATREFYRNKLKHPTTYNSEFAEKKLAELENGTGQTYFEIIIEIIASHRNIGLICEQRD